MIRFRPHLILRLAVVVLLALNVVPEALAAFPLCKSDFGPVQPLRSHSPAAATTTLKHSHGIVVAHECVATMPDRQSVAQQSQMVPSSPAVVTVSLPHPVSMLAARGPSPRGSPAQAYLVHRASVQLLI